MVKVHQREHTGIGTRTTQMGSDVGALKMLRRVYSLNHLLADVFRERIFKLRSQTSSPWSCKRIRVLNFVPNPGTSLYLLWAMASIIAGLPRSYSTIFAPFSQCSPCFPRTMMRD